MKKIAVIFSSVILFASNVWAINISGDFGAQKNNLEISQNSSEAKVVGSFLGRTYDYVMSQSSANEISIKGVVAGVASDIYLRQDNGVLIVVDQKNHTDLKIELRDFKTIFSGRYNNKQTSLTIGKLQPNTVSGFFDGNLNDLRIYRTKDGLQFDGYINGFWTNIQMVNGDSTSSLSGKIMDRETSYVINTNHMNIDDLLEMIVLGFSVPGVELFSL